MKHIHALLIAALFLSASYSTSSHAQSRGDRDRSARETSRHFDGSETTPVQPTPVPIQQDKYERIIEHLRSPSEGDRRFGYSPLNSLSPLEKKEIAPKLIRILRNQDRYEKEETRRTMISALGQLTSVSNEAFQALKEALLEDADHEVRKIAASSMARAPFPKETVPLLIAAFTKDPSVRSEAAESLGALGSVALEAVPVLAQSLQKRCNRSTIAALGKIGEPKQGATEALMKCLEDVEESVRLDAVSALGNLGAGAAKAIPSLLRTLKWDNGTARGLAAEALGKMGASAKAAVPILAEALQSNDYYLRFHATQALGNIGPEAKEAVPALIERLNGSEDRDALKALQKIGTREAVEAVEQFRSKHPIPGVRD